MTVQYDKDNHQNADAMVLLVLLKRKQDRDEVVSRRNSRWSGFARASWAVFVTMTIVGRFLSSM